jgi:hypothetical protein
MLWMSQPINDLLSQYVLFDMKATSNWAVKIKYYFNKKLTFVKSLHAGNGNVFVKNIEGTI